MDTGQDEECRDGWTDGEGQQRRTSNDRQWLTDGQTYDGTYKD